MAHQPFENWLLSIETLPADRQIELDNHLLICPECRNLQTSLKEVHRLLDTAKPLAPRPGFSQRWQTLATRRKLEQEPRQVRIFFLFLLQAAIFSLALLVTIMLVGKVSLAQIIMPFAHIVATGITLSDQALRWISTNLSGPATLAIWILIAMGICLLVITWVVTVIRINMKGARKNETNL